MNRNLIDVINEMLFVVPKKETDIITTLVDIRESQRVRAPEDMLGWQCVSDLLNTFTFNKHTPEWKMEMCSIFSMQPIDEIKKYCKTH